MGEVLVALQGEVFFKREVLRVLLPAMQAHSSRLTPNASGKLPAFPRRRVPFDVRFKIKNAWPAILDRLGEQDVRGATALAVEAGFPAPAFRKMLSDKVQFALSVIHASLRLGGVPDVDRLRTLVKTPGRFGGASIETFARAVLHPPMANRIIPLLVYSRGSRGAWTPEKSGKVFCDVMLALEKGDEKGAANALVKAGMAKEEAVETLGNLARFADFVLDGVLAYESDAPSVRNVVKSVRNMDAALKRVYVEGAALKRALSREDLRIINMTVDVCRAG